MVPSACATTPRRVLGLPSLSSVTQAVVGCCWISSQCFISPKLLPVGCVFGVLEVLVTALTQPREPWCCGAGVALAAVLGLWHG